MKKNSFFLKLIAGLLLLFAAPPQLCRAAINQISYTANYNGTPVFGTDTLGGVTYSTISYGDLMNGGSPGMPSLPIDYIRFSVPYNATNFRVVAIKLMNQSHNLEHLMYPCQAPRMMNDTTPVVITLPDTAAYYSGTSFPSTVAWVVDEGFLDGANHIVTVAVMPFSYRHTATSDAIGQWRRISLTLRYSLSDSLAMYPIVRNDSLLREEGYQLAQSMVVNPNQVKSFSVGYNFIEHIDSMGINPNGIGGDGLNVLDPPIPIPDTTEINTTGIPIDYYPYLIVTTSELSHSVRRIAALKRQKGFNVKVVTMDDVMHAPFAQSGDRYRRADGSYVAYTDSAGVLRQYLKWYYKFFGTKYVLLAGNIPYRHINQVLSYKNKNGDSIHETIDCISDFYYIDLNSNWLTGEISDHAPDLYVGRILAKESAQIDNYSDKLFMYELNPGRGDYSYLRRLIMQEGNDFESSLTGFKRLKTDYFPQRLSLPYSNIDGRDVINTLNSNPAGLINMFNHGDTTNIMICGGKENYPRSYIYSDSPLTDGDGLNCLNNRDYPMIFYSSACQTVPFDNNFGVNMGESFTTGKNYGGPVYIGYTRKIWRSSLQGVNNYFARNLNSGHFTLGEADALSIWDFKGDLAPIVQDPSPIHAYIGDPSVEIWTDIPHKYQSANIECTDNSVTISGIDTIPTTVVYCSSDTIIERIATDTIMSINASPNGCLMLYSHNCIPFIAPMMLQNVNLNKSQYVIANDFTAGYNVDCNCNRTHGDVVVKSGTNYEIEASGTTTLCAGFAVEAGASFSVIPSSF